MVGLGQPQVAENLIAGHDKKRKDLEVRGGG